VPPAPRPARAEAPDLPDWDGGPADLVDELDGVRVVGLDLDGTDLPELRVDHCVLDGVTVGSSTLRRSDLTQVWWRDCRLTGSDVLDADWTDVDLQRCVLAGVALSGGTFRRVVLRRCKLDAVTLRAGRLDQVRFEDCVIRSLDLAGSTLTDVSFPGSRVDDLDLTKARCERVDLRDADVQVARGADGLRGVVVTPAQLLDLAPLLAADAGLRVEPPTPP
jgi:uncharacterized protein YjbI with pentapeptide repeats